MWEHRRASAPVDAAGGGDTGLLQQGGQGGVGEHLPSSEHLRVAPLLGTHRQSTFCGKDVQPPRFAASFTRRATAAGFFRKEAHLVLNCVGPPRAGQQEMIYLPSEVAREGMILLPYPHLCVGLRPRNSEKRTPSPKEWLMNRKSYPRSCEIFFLDIYASTVGRTALRYLTRVQICDRGPVLSGRSPPPVGSYQF